MDQPTEQHAAGNRVDAQRQWWVAMDGVPEGPHSEAYIRLLYLESRIGAETLVCRVGDNYWRPATACAWLVADGGGGETDHRPPPLPIPVPRGQFTVAEALRWITNPSLPLFGNLICAYCLAVRPALTVLGLLVTLAWNTSSGWTADSPLWFFAIVFDGFEAVVHVGIATMLVLGGLGLRSLRAYGPPLIRLGLTLSVVGTFLSCQFSLLWQAVAAAGNSYAETEEELTAAGMAAFACLLLLLLLLVLASAVFDIVALIWLTISGHRLRARALPQTPTGSERQEDSRDN
jgi:hypothetical protein